VVPSHSELELKNWKLQAVLCNFLRWYWTTMGNSTSATSLLPYFYFWCIWPNYAWYMEIFTNLESIHAALQSQQWQIYHLYSTHWALQDFMAHTTYCMLFLYQFYQIFSSNLKCDKWTITPNKISNIFAFQIAYFDPIMQTHRWKHTVQPSAIRHWTEN